jgi:hypothetical protein
VPLAPRPVIRDYRCNFPFAFAELDTEAAQKVTESDLLDNALGLFYNPIHNPEYDSNHETLQG